MDRKSRIMAIAAIGAVAILIASSAIRCSVAKSAEDGAERAASAASEQTAQRQEGYASSDVQAVASTTTQAASAIDTLKGKAWRSDAGASVTFRDGMYVETDGQTTKITAFTVDSESAKDGQTTLALSLYRDGSADAVQSVMVVKDAGDGKATVASDQFQMGKSYRESAQARTAFSVAGVNDEYRALVGGDEAGLDTALGSYMASHVPSASRASFDGEVYVDYNAKTVLATFTCDDAARTILTVTYSGGAFKVNG